VYFKGKPLGGVKSFKMDWNADEQLGHKWCTIYAIGDDKKIALEFMAELTKYGFGGEIISKDSITEYYHSDGKVVREIKNVLRLKKLESELHKSGKEDSSLTNFIVEIEKKVKGMDECVLETNSAALSDTAE
jgi:hypothetical protein